MSFTTRIPLPLAPDRRDLPLDALAARVGEELETLARLSAEVQTALSLCRFAEHPDPAAIRGLQGIDRITQALEDLGRLMAAVSGELSDNVLVHAGPIMSRIRLHELVQNLDPDARIHDTQALASDGNVHWF